MTYLTAQNLSRFSSGELRFWIYSSTGAVKVEIKDFAGFVTLFKPLDSYIGSNYNRWIHVRIPFAGNLILPGTGLSSVGNPILFTGLTTPATFYIDNVRYVDTTASPIFNVSLRNIANNSPAAELTWGGVNLPAGWVRADQYIRLDLDPGTASWGVQIYTDNMSAGANPVFTGDPAVTDPAGLVDATETDRRLPLAWNIQSSTTTPPASGDPDTTFIWFYMKDKATPGFINGDGFMTVKNQQGIQYAQTFFGSLQVPPNPVYIEAHFGAAVTPRTYRTSTLRVEFFTD